MIQRTHTVRAKEKDKLCQVWHRHIHASGTYPQMNGLDKGCHWV